ncbi:MAG: Gfo/Idh/MocA family oxidoreductase, partial [Solirubrobacteraceae bacterium]
VCDPRREAAEHAADLVEELLGARPSVFQSAEELIASGAVEAIDLVTEPSIHHLIAVPALAAGIHVLSEKPLGVTVRACREMVDAAAAAGAVLATAENYRRDGPNRLARAVLDSGMLGEIHLMIESNIGGDDAVLISPWRHLREKGSIALDMGVHYTDIFSYFLGELERVCGVAFIAEPGRVLGAEMIAGDEITELAPGVMRATGDDSLLALYETAAGARIQLTYLPSGPGRRWIQRSLHGRNGSMSVPFDRTGGPVVVELGARRLTGAELRSELGDFRLGGVAAEFFGPEGTEYDLPFAEVDAATIAIELDDFIGALGDGRFPEVDGRAGLLAVAGVWAIAESYAAGGFVAIADVADGVLSAAQDPVDAAIGLLTKAS